MGDVVEQYVSYGESWVEELTDLFPYIGRRFKRREMQERALD